MKDIITDHFYDGECISFPIKSNYGEGFTFNIGKKQYITKGYCESVSLKLKPRKQDNELIKISLLNTVPIKLFLNK